MAHSKPAQDVLGFAFCRSAQRGALPCRGASAEALPCQGASAEALSEAEWGSRMGKSKGATISSARDVRAGRPGSPTNAIFVRWGNRHDFRRANRLRRWVGFSPEGRLNWAGHAEERCQVRSG